MPKLPKLSDDVVNDACEALSLLCLENEVKLPDLLEAVRRKFVVDYKLPRLASDKEYFDGEWRDKF